MKPRLQEGQRFVVAGGFEDPLYKDKARVVVREIGEVEGPGQGEVLGKPVGGGR